MSFTVQAETAPIGEDVGGALRVGESRVLLELVVRAFEDGATPESIVQRYPTLWLADVYAVVAYFLRHQAQVAEYLSKREAHAAKLRAEIEHRQGDLSAIRGRLLERRRL